MPFGMGFGELVLILIIVVVVFGATKLPQLGDGLGKAIKNFKRAVNSQNEIDVSPGARERQEGRARRRAARPSPRSSASGSTVSASPVACIGYFAADDSALSDATRCKPA